MKFFINRIVLAFFALAITAGVSAGDKGSADEAVAMVKKAASFLKENGKEKAFAEFNNAQGQFKDRDLYVFAIDMNGKMLAHGANGKLIDKNLIDLKDADGKHFVKTYIDIASSKGKGWTDYKWANPVTKAIDAKSLYFEKAGDLVIGCGIYKG